MQVKLVRGDLTSLQRATIGALVVIDVHGRDVVTEMVADKVATNDDFSWQSRLRWVPGQGFMAQELGLGPRVRALTDSDFPLVKFCTRGFALSVTCNRVLEF